MEHISTTTLIIILIIMVFISASFSGSETGMMTFADHVFSLQRQRTGEWCTA
ncbi:hypothetical protein ACAG12_26715, partial [Escherichia coli]|uniref:hypothetical protein n=1 Tax=Escherichia coli TaxID=562 RepID=UPI003FCD7871